jgi:universal stress protein A
MQPIKTILYATDESAASRFAFSAARAIASKFGARLIILEVEPPAVTIYGPASEGYLKRMQQGLDQFQVDDPAVHVERRVAEGVPATEIVRAAKESNCDLILMASHGRTGVKRLVFGSVAEAVIRHSRCPVLVVKMPESSTELVTPKSNDSRVPMPLSTEQTRPSGSLVSSNQMEGNQNVCGTNLRAKCRHRRAYGNGPNRGSADA